MIKRVAVGGEIDSYCGRCKMTLNHMITALVDGMPRRVRCLTCQSEHNHRIPKQKTSRSRTSSGSNASRSRSAQSSADASAAKWNSRMVSWDDSAAKPYSIYESFGVDDLLTHVKFGRGIVINVPEPDKIITLFESGEKMLMQGKQKS